jgi:hypothetical protein
VSPSIIKNLISVRRFINDNNCSDTMIVSELKNSRYIE